MNELRIQKVQFAGDEMTVQFSDGCQIALFVDCFPRLMAASVAERNAWQLIGRGLGVHWDSVDEDLSVENILTAYSRSRKDAYASSHLVTTKS